MLKKKIPSQSGQQRIQKYGSSKMKNLGLKSDFADMGLKLDFKSKRSAFALKGLNFDIKSIRLVYSQ